MTPLQEYLSPPGILSGVHKILGETCLAYLNYDQVKRLSTNKVGGLQQMPFLEYSSLFWDAHAKIELSDRGKALAIELLNQLQSHISFTFFSKNIWAPNPHFFFMDLLVYTVHPPLGLVR